MYLFTYFNESVRTRVIFYVFNKCYPSKLSQLHSERFWQWLKKHWFGGHSRLKPNNKQWKFKLNLENIFEWVLFRMNVFFLNLFWWSIYNIKFTISALFKYTVQWQKYIHIVGPPHHDASPEIFHHPNGRVASEYIQVWLFFQIDFLEMFFWRNFWIISQFLKRMCIWVHHTSSISSNACFALFVC